MRRVGVRPAVLVVLVSSGACAINCGDEGATPPVIVQVQPTVIAGGRAAQLRIEALGLSATPTVQVGGLVVPSQVNAEGQLEVQVPPQRRGQAQVTVLSRGLKSSPFTLSVDNSPPQIKAPGPQLVQVGDEIRVQIETADFDGDPLTLSALDLPDGATLDGVTQQVVFRPNAMQGDLTFRSTLTVDDGTEVSHAELDLQVVRVLPQLTLGELDPNPGPGGRAFDLEVKGDGFSPGTQVVLQGVALATELRSSLRLVARVPASARGHYEVVLTRAMERTAPLSLEILNAPPALELPEALNVDEETELSASISASDLDQDALRIALFDLPPGAVFDETTGQFSFRPDFIQGGDSFEVRAEASDGTSTSTGSFTVTVNDTIQPPWPEVVSSEDRGDYTLLVLNQTTDAFLDSPGYAGRSFSARISVPTRATPQVPYPVRVFLHGFGGSPYTGGQGDQFRIYPHDPDNTYWWGYSTRAPSSVNPGPVPPYTARRVLHLVEWALRNYPGANPEQVYLNGGSMGGAGAAAIGILWARHFAMVEATIAQMIARNHRPSRLAQLSGFYGVPQDDLPDDLGIPVWDRLDLVRALAESEESRNQFVFSRHAKDDPTIHFGAAVLPSPRVPMSWLQALQDYKVGHFAVWDEGAHGPSDPVMGTLWWDGGWNRMSDPETYLNRNRAFIAFSNSDADGDPGDGTGNGRQPWSAESGFAGSRDVPGDTGWSGELVGSFNRYLRWDSRGVIDTWARFSVPVRAKVGAGDPPPAPGYPPRGDRYDGPLPIRADLTPRRVQAFKCRPGELVNWRFGAQSGQVQADSRGTITVPQLPLTDTWTTLELSR